MATFKRACNEIATYECSQHSLFTWLSGIARKCAFQTMNEEQENAGRESTNEKCLDFSAFELVYFKGVSLKEAAQLSGITIAELKTTIRITLQNVINKTAGNDQ
jgi:hypothetical protein